MKKQVKTDEEFTSIVKESYSYAEVIKKLSLHVAGSNYDTVKRRIKKLNLDITHFKGSAWSRGKKLESTQSRPLKDVLVKNSTWISTWHLKNRLLKEGLKQAKCECCGLTEWQGKPIALELHHINGQKDDLRIENLQILCPNCHAFTDNYRGRSIKVQSAQQETSEQKQANSANVTAL